MANVGESATVIVKSPNGIINNCSIHPPYQDTSIDIIDGNEQSKYEYIGAKNNSCSFKIANITENFFGEWRVFSKYRSSDRNVENELVFDING